MTSIQLRPSKKFRDWIGLFQSEYAAAKKIGCSQSSLNNFLKGKTGISGPVLARVIEITGLKYEDLIERWIVHHHFNRKRSAGAETCGCDEHKQKRKMSAPIEYSQSFKDARWQLEKATHYILTDEETGRLFELFVPRVDFEGVESERRRLHERCNRLEIELQKCCGGILRSDSEGKK